VRDARRARAGFVRRGRWFWCDAFHPNFLPAGPRGEPSLKASPAAPKFSPFARTLRGWRES
jgi:hypothetical protein